VHATTEILPVGSVSLPPQFVDAALAAMNVTFRADGLLTDQAIPAPAPMPAGTPGAPTILTPVPRENAGTWSWLEREGDAWIGYPTGPNDTVARLSNVPPVLRRGMLQLSSGLASARRRRAGPPGRRRQPSR
jgi:hypothetical protein